MFQLNILKKTALLLTLISAGMVSGCVEVEAEPVVNDNNQLKAATIPRHNLPFVYYLQAIDYNKLKKLNPAIAVVDPYDSKLTKEQIKDLQDNFGQKIFAYISAGEVDPTRKNSDDGYYFRPEWKNADWLTIVPKNVQDNDRWATKRVAFWLGGWHKIMTDRTKHMANMGYDGVMLDTVDTYQAFENGNLRTNPKQDMADLVGAVRDAGASINPDFKTMANGGMELIHTSYSKTGEPYMKVIWGQLKEDSWYNENGVIAEEWTPYDLKLMKQAVDYGLPVFSIDYFSDEKVKTPNKENMQKYMNISKSFGVVPFAADRLLGKFIQFNKEYFADDNNWQNAINHDAKP